jgi:hypothetical protein
MPELQILVKGLMAGMRACLCTLGLLLIIIYMFAILFTRLSSDEGGLGFFATVPEATNFLFVQAICGLDPSFFHTMLQAGWGYWVLALFYTFVTMMTMMNMLIGVLCDVVSGVAEREKEKKLLEDLESQVSSIVEELDTEHNGYLSKEEFEDILRHPAMLRSLNALGVDLVAFVDFTRFAFPKRGLSMQDFLHLVLQFRGAKEATVKDIVDMRKFMCMMMKQLEGKLLQDFELDLGISDHHSRGRHGGHRVLQHQQPHRTSSSELQC